MNLTNAITLFLLVASLISSVNASVSGLQETDATIATNVFASDSKASKGTVAGKGSKSPHASKAGKGLKVTTSPTSAMMQVIEIIVSAGDFTAPYYTFTVEGSAVDVASYEFIKGQTYKFVSTGDDVHPFFIGDVYSAGANPGSSFPITSTGTPATGIYDGNSLQFQLPLNFSNILYYYCVVPTHQMVGGLKIKQ
jgi:hypothetical protein